jgi:hypothetical protein
MPLSLTLFGSPRMAGRKMIYSLITIAVCGPSLNLEFITDIVTTLSALTCTYRRESLFGIWLGYYVSKKFLSIFLGAEHKS